jgi:hypothetical protein
MNAKDEVIWSVVENTKGQRKVPEWLRSAAMDSEGRIYIPAVVGGNEAVVSLNMMHDGTPVVISEDHVYAPIDWLIAEYPKQKGDLEHIRQRLVEAFSQHSEIPTA